MFKALFAALALSCVPTAISAVTLDFARMPATGWSDDFTFGGVTISAGTELDGKVRERSASVSALSHIGLGVRSSDDTGLADLTSQIDSLGSNDVIIFEFDRAVRLERIGFTGTEWWDRFDLYVGAGLSFDSTLKVDDLAGFDWISSVGLGSDVIGTRFAIGAAEYSSCGYSISLGQSCWLEDSGFHISSITFTDLESIPLPSAFWFLLSAVLGTCLARRDRKL